VQVLVVDEHLRLEHRGGVGAQPGRARTDLEAGVGAVQRLALFAREQAGQWFGVRVDRVGVGGAPRRSGVLSFSAAAARLGLSGRARVLPTGERMPSCCGLEEGRGLV